MNVGTQDDDSIHKLDHINEIDNLNIIINSPVAKDEIEKGIKRLKNEKSSAKSSEKSFSLVFKIYINNLAKQQKWLLV
jgi:TusA-related sulfurtransferase